jgi:hypothetical protein
VNIVAHATYIWSAETMEHKVHSGADVLNHLFHFRY